MISDADIEAIRQTAQLYGLKRVLLFGSAADPKKTPRDIDLAVEGLEPYRYFDFWGDLLMKVSITVDIVDLSRPGRFLDIVREEGKPIYIGNARPVWPIPSGAQGSSKFRFLPYRWCSHRDVQF